MLHGNIDFAKSHVHRQFNILLIFLSCQNISSILLEHRRLAATTNELKIKSGGHQISRPT